MKTMAFDTNLKENLAKLNINVKESDLFPDYLCVNYTIDTPKLDPVALQSRGHIIDVTTNEFVCRPFDRFFNLGEAGLDEKHCEDLVDWGNNIIVEKLDGSLIKLWYDNKYTKKWYIGTRQSFDGSNTTIDGKTFLEIFIEALNEIGYKSLEEFTENFNTQYTYLFELTSKHNRVIIDYGERPQIWLLAIRSNVTGKYITQSGCDLVAKFWRVKRPRTYKFNNLNDCVAMSKTLKFDDEGYIVYNKDNKPFCKIKSPSYVAIHLSSNGGNPSETGIIEVVLKYEEEEFKTYFPNIKIDMYIEARDRMFDAIRLDIDSIQTKGIVEDRKQVALTIKDKPYSSVIFSVLYKKESLHDAFSRLSESSKSKILKSFIEN